MSGRDPDWQTGADEHLRLLDRRLRTEMETLGRQWSASDLTCDVPDAGLELPEYIAGLLFGGGKRVRPLFCYLGWLAAGPPEYGYDDVLQASAALELLHVFALLHDDVMDASATRRGLPTLHVRLSDSHRQRGGTGDPRRFGENVALLAGDLAHAEADRLAAVLPPTMRDQWRALVIELVAGQAADLVGSSAPARNLDFARSVARSKSGGYTVVRPLLLGAQAARSPKSVISALHGFGEHAGEAFALRDDVLGAFGDTAATGKPAGDDLRSGKPTAVLALAEQMLAGPSRRLLDTVATAGLDGPDVRDLQDALVEHGVLAAVEGLIADRVASAELCVRSSPIEPVAVTALNSVLHAIAWRQA